MNATKKSLIDAIFEKGILIDLKFSNWTGQVKISPKDFGFESVPDLMTLGRKRLIRKELVSKPTNISVTARQWIDNHTHPFPLSRARFIPEAEINKTIEKLNKYKVDFYNSVDALMSEYEAEKDLMIETWKIEIPRHFGEKVDLDEAIKRLQMSYPTLEHIRNSYRFDWSLFEIQIPDKMATKIESFNFKEKFDSEIDEFIRLSVSHLRNKLVDLTEHVRSAMNDQSDTFQIPTRSKNAIMREIDTLKALNFFDDSEIDANVENIKNTLLNSDSMSKKSVESKIEDVLKIVSENIDNSVKSALNNLTGGGYRNIKI